MCSLRIEERFLDDYRAGGRALDLKKAFIYPHVHVCVVSVSPSEALKQKILIKLN